MADPVSAQRLRVFISYSRRNSAFAEDLLTALETCGFEAYLDRRDVQPGEPWEERLERLIQSADTIVFVISPAFLASERCEWEIDKAVGVGKRMMPVIHEPVAEAQVPRRLRRLNYTLFAGEGRTFAKGLADLSRALNTDLVWMREHTRLADLALRWNTRDRNEALLLRGSEIATSKDWIAKQPKDAPAPMLLHREYIAISEQAEQQRVIDERAREAAARDGEIKRVRAEQEAERFRLEAEKLKAEQAAANARSKQRQMHLAYGAVAATAILVAVGLALWQRDAAQRLESTQQSLAIAERERRIAELENERNNQKLSQSQASRTPEINKKDFDKRISQQAIEMIIKFELGLSGSSLNPNWVGASSGVTIGYGYDLGYNTLEDFRRDWQAVLPQEALSRLSEAIGTRGEPAKALAAKLSDIQISENAARAVFVNNTIPRYARLVDRALPNTDEVSPDSFGALVSLVYNRGASFQSSGDRYIEMRNIRKFMEEKQFARIPSELRAMKRLWAGQNLPALLARRDAEADLFEKGLASIGK